MAKTKKGPLPGQRKRQMRQRTGFKRSELPELYRMRHFADSGEKPADREYAKSYKELADAFGCSETLVAAACAEAEALRRAGGIERIGTRFVLSRKGAAR